ncbi:MAG: hypothetical protein IKL28_04440 [Lachnospiraceae bacterium]|nr:hypothetical protein [Lachnospiraceae bacterium]
MKYIVIIIAILYALLSMLAASTQLKKAGKRDTHLMMLVGGMLLVVASILQLTNGLYDWVIATLGGILICVAAFYNGKRSGNFHANHHVVRGCITLGLIAGFILW